MAFARRIALDKARAVPAPGCWVLSADTIVHVGGDLFQKPCDDDDATRILSALAGRWHTVTTAWCLRWGGGPPPAGRRQLRGAVHSRVRFRALTAAEIATYVASGEGRDKAGSYGIQERGVMLIDRVVGSFTNVVGLPMVQVMSALCQVGIDPEAP